MLDKQTETLGQSLGDQTQSLNVACSQCQSRGLRCTFIQSGAKYSRGRRIVEIQRARQRIVHVHSTSSLDGIQRPLKLDASNNVLGIAGLTRTLVDACVRNFFSDIHSCRPILHPDHFSQSYEAFWQHSSQETCKVQPCHSVLILAIACLGAGQLEAPVAEQDSLAKFHLRNRLAARYQEWFEEYDWNGWYHQTDACDIVEAALLMSELQVGMLDEEQDALDKEDIIAKNNSASTVKGPIWRMSAPRIINGLCSVPGPSARTRQKGIFSLDPCSHEFMIRAALRLGINRRPKTRVECSKDDPKTLQDVNGTYITPRESFRRVRVFWSVFLLDTFQCFGKRQSPYIGDDDYDQDLPRWSNLDFPIQYQENHKPNHSNPLYDYSPYKAKKDTPSDPEPANRLAQPVEFIRFDEMASQNVFKLLFIVRATSLYFVSVRSARMGIWSRDVTRVLSGLRAWSDQLPREISWDLHYSLVQRSQTSIAIVHDSTLMLRNAKRTLLLEYLYHSLLVGIWASIEDFGLRRVKMEETESISLLLARLGLHGQELWPDEVLCDEENVMNDLMHQLIKSFFRMGSLAEQAAEFNILRCSRTQLMSVTATYALLGCGIMAEKIEKRTTTWPTSTNDYEEIFFHVSTCTEKLIKALDSIDTWLDAPEIARQLRQVFTDLKRLGTVSLDDKKIVEGLAKSKDLVISADMLRMFKVEVTIDNIGGLLVTSQPFHSFEKRAKKSSTIHEEVLSFVGESEIITPKEALQWMKPGEVAKTTQNLGDVEKLSFNAYQSLGQQSHDWLSSFLSQEILLAAQTPIERGTSTSPVQNIGSSHLNTSSTLPMNTAQSSMQSSGVDIIQSWVLNSLDPQMGLTMQP